ncbi:MAG: hypothetical protein HY761_04600 [Candidatus Omnitrophica bacterium]|nr:hypothetical protein [Candidatus Omnitrophota bacterium]
MTRKLPVKKKTCNGLILFIRLSLSLERFHLVKDHHNRELHLDQYLSLILFYFFNPILSSLRGIQQVSHLEKVKKMLGVKGTILGSLSEASNVFDANLVARTG